MTSTRAISVRIATIAEIFATDSLVPAAVQRDFKWEERDCELLIGDIDRVFMAASGEQRIMALPAPAALVDDDPITVEMPDEAPDDEVPLRDYHLGSLVLRTRPDGVVEIYDGLQRLTTLTILLAVIRDLTGSTGLADELDRLVSTADARPRLALAGKDRTLAGEIQRRGEAQRQRRSPPSSDQARRLRAAARLFRTTIATWSEYRRGRFADFLLEGVTFDVLEAADPRLARQIFVTTNARGVALDQVDIFKGQLADLAEDDAEAEEIVRHWSGVQHRVGDDLHDLLLAVDFIERRKSQGPDALAALAGHIAGRGGERKALAWVRRLAMAAGAWDEMHRWLAAPGEHPTHVDIWRLGCFRWREWKPLALLWYHDDFQRQAKNGAAGRTPSPTLAKRFDALHRRCMAITLANYSDSDRATIFGRAIQEASNRRDPLTGALKFNPPAQERMRATLRLPLLHSETRLSLLRWTEAMLWGSDPIPEHIGQATVEHILPQRPHANSQWLRDHPSEEDRFLLCHSLGNLASLDMRANLELENFDFAEKLPVLQAKAQSYKLLQDVVTAERWSAEVIAERAQRLAEFVMQELRLPAWLPPKERA